MPCDPVLAANQWLRPYGAHVTAHKEPCPSKDRASAFSGGSAPTGLRPALVYTFEESTPLRQYVESYPQKARTPNPQGVPHHLNA